MDYQQTTYQHQPDAAFWNRFLRDHPRQNISRLLFDFSIQSGVATGLGVEAQAVPTLSVTVRAGRAIYRDAAARLAAPIELLQDFTLDLSALVPTAAAVTVYVVAEPLLDDSVLPTILVAGAPLGDPAYDPLYVPGNLKTGLRDSATIKAVTAVVGQQVILATVTLTPGQGSITASSLGFAARKLATVSEELRAFESRVAAVEGSDGAQNADIADLKQSVLQHAATLQNHDGRIDALEITKSLQQTNFRLQAVNGASIYMRADNDIDLTGLAGKRALITIAPFHAVQISNNGAGAGQYENQFRLALLFAQSQGAAKSEIYGSNSDAGQLFTAIGGTLQPNGELTLQWFHRIDVNSPARPTDMLILGGAFIVAVPAGLSAVRPYLALFGDDTSVTNVPSNRPRSEIVSGVQGPATPGVPNDHAFSRVPISIIAL